MMTLIISELSCNQIYRYIVSCRRTRRTTRSSPRRVILTSSSVAAPCRCRKVARQEAEGGESRLQMRAFAVAIFLAEVFNPACNAMPVRQAEPSELCSFFSVFFLPFSPPCPLPPFAVAATATVDAAFASAEFSFGVTALSAKCSPRIKYSLALYLHTYI